MIDISGLDKGAVLAALYNASRPQGMGFLHYTPEDMTPEEGADFVRNYNYFDYLKGRVMKINLKTDELDPCLYDRDNGRGAAEAVIAKLRKEQGR
jgi:hypothetical protein